MGNKDNSRYHRKSKQKPSARQRENVRAATAARAAQRNQSTRPSTRYSAANKENNPSFIFTNPPRAPSSITPSHPTNTCPTLETAVREPMKSHTIRTSTKKLESAKRHIRRLKKDKAKLKVQLIGLRNDLKNARKDNFILQKRIAGLEHDFQAERKKFLDFVADAKRSAYLRSEDRQNLREKVYALKQKASRLEGAHLFACNREKQRTSNLAWLRRRGVGGSYGNKARELARELTAAGCSRAKVGKLIQLVGRTFGIDVRGAMSRRTVSRAILEGGIASKLQAAYEIKNTQGMSISQDSTSHRKQNYESHHYVPKVPDYDEVKALRDAGSSAPAKVSPCIRVLPIEATLDHSSQGSVDSWQKINTELTELFGRSPLAKRLDQKYSVHDFLRVVKSMHGDHANNEKATADELRRLKKESSIHDLGEQKLAELQQEQSDLILYMTAWSEKKLEEVGGLDAWERLTPTEQARIDSALLERIIKTLGQEAYDSLSDSDRREIDLFIWSGCCMHKDLNSFKGGNVEMMAEWSKLGVEPPVVLANKANAAILSKAVDPASDFDKLSELEQQAFLNSTRGGVKASALAGALFNNKDDKKGQGDVHVDYFKQFFGPNHRRFPDTNNTRFSSYGEAAAELLKHLAKYVQFVEDIPYAKTNPTRTNLEQNLLRALKDPATRTELAAMTLYMNVVSHPYLRVVRGTNQNALDLGPLHVEVQTHIQKILDNPNLLFEGDTSYTHETGSLDGKEWEDGDAVKAVFDLAQSIPHLKSVTLAFLRGSLATWTRFSSEFAPGGLIDLATPEEKYLAWMPATNDANEGMLGYYRVTMRGHPTLTLHQFNAMAMYTRNGTRSFMAAIFEEEDHLFIRKAARQMDASGLEAQRRAEQAAFRLRVVNMNREKEETKKQKAEALRVKLAGIPLIRDISELDGVPRLELDPKRSGKWTGFIYDLQLDALRFRSVPLPMKKDMTKVAQKRAALVEGFRTYSEKLKNLGRCWPQSLGDDAVINADLELPIIDEPQDTEELEID